MKNNFQIAGIDYSEVEHFFQLSDEELQKENAVRVIADKSPGYPCRVSLQDARMGEELILFPFNHHETASPYRASGPVFVRKGAQTARPGINEIPVMLNHRLLSVRAYDHFGMIKQAEVLKGDKLRTFIDELFEDPDIKYLHIHNARPGCYNCTVFRAQG